MDISLVLLTLTLLVLPLKAQNECQSRDYGNGAAVCVCNSDYCDTLPKPEEISQPQYLKYTSNKAGLRFQKETGDFQQTKVLADNVIFINSSEEYQTIIGWGGAFTDAAGINLKSLDDNSQEHLLQSYFSDVGIGYNLCRVPIGGTDFSLRGYSYNDGDPDPELLNFQLAEEDFVYKIPFIKRALNLTNSNLKLFASAWTAPIWMKTNNAYAGMGGFLITEMYQPWANYFVKFLDSYGDEGIKFWGITTGNEPSLALVPNEAINSVAWLADQMVEWLSTNLGPTLRSSDHSEIKIMAIDDQRFFLPWYVDSLTNDSVTNDYIDGIAVHWYGNAEAPAAVLTETHEHAPDKFILATEACNGYQDDQLPVILGSWERGEFYSSDIIEDLLNWVTGWVDWNMALDLTGGPTYINNTVDSPIIINATAGEFYKQPTYYHLGHFSKFVLCDSVRIFASTFDDDVAVIAFKRPDAGRVTVILNKKDETVSAALVDDARGNTQLELTPRSITTILYW